jgi:transcriptional regulator with XRE-family HTH domain
MELQPGRPINLRAWRLFRVLTQAELADAAGLSERSLRDLENGTPPRISTLRRLAKALGIEPSDLYRLPEEREP